MSPRAKLLDKKATLSGRGSPHPNQMIHGKRRGQWVRDAAKALIGSTTPARRFMIMREGFDVFQKRAKFAFQEDAGFQLTANELRWIFEYIAKYILRARFKYQGGLMTERSLQPEFERMYQKQLRKNLTPASDENDAPLDITVENARGQVIH